MNSTLYAQWGTNEYNVEFDYADEITEKVTQKITFDETFNVSKPVREGYTFTGWNISVCGHFHRPS